MDILSGRLLEADGTRPGPLRLLVELDLPLGAVARIAGEEDTMDRRGGTGIALLSSSGDLEWMARPADGGTPRRMNDAVCDPAGRFWAGCMAWDSSPGAGALFRTDHDGTVTQVLDGLTIPNGPAFTSDGTAMYLADSARAIVLRFPVDPLSGGLGEPIPFVTLDAGSPDGMAVDVEGNVWVAVWGLGEVHQYAPAGTLLTRVRVPAPQPTATCLGGADGRRLFITTARYGLSPGERRQSGSVFSLEVSVPGMPASAYRTR